MARGGRSNAGGKGAQGNLNQNGEILAILDSSSPYFLHSGDHPGLNLVSNLLNGVNYHTWQSCNGDGSYSEEQNQFLLMVRFSDLLQLI